MGYILDGCKQSNLLKTAEENIFVDLHAIQEKNFSTKRKYEIICFNNKKKILYHELLENNQIYYEVSKILNSCMVIIRTNAFFKKKMISMLGEICAAHKCFAPIVYSEDNDIIFFPKLRYQDSYLIKSILESVMQDKQYWVAYGSENMVII